MNTLRENISAGRIRIVVTCQALLLVISISERAYAGQTSLLDIVKSVTKKFETGKAPRHCSENQKERLFSPKETPDLTALVCSTEVEAIKYLFKEPDYKVLALTYANSDIAYSSKEAKEYFPPDKYLHGGEAWYWAFVDLKNNFNSVAPLSANTGVGYAVVEKGNLISIYLERNRTEVVIRKCGQTPSDQSLCKDILAIKQQPIVKDPFPPQEELNFNTLKEYVDILLKLERCPEGFDLIESKGNEGFCVKKVNGRTSIRISVSKEGSDKNTRLRADRITFDSYHHKVTVPDSFQGIGKKSPAYYLYTKLKPIFPKLLFEDFGNDFDVHMKSGKVDVSFQANYRDSDAFYIALQR